MGNVHLQPEIEQNPTAEPVRWIGVPTKNRPLLLSRCLRSHLVARQLYGRHHEFIVVDDTANGPAQQQLREEVAALGHEFATAIRYVGIQAKDELVNLLTRRTGIGTDVISFALAPAGYPVGTGGSRNTLLLCTAGSQLLQVDDDTLCLGRGVANASPALMAAQVGDPTEFWFPEAKDVTLSDATDVLNLPAIHEGLLGRQIVQPASGRVAITMAGVRGDSGMGSSLHLLGLAGPSRDRLLASEQVYRRALSERFVSRAATAPTVAVRASCMALNLGVDNRELMPPFLPVMRNQDGVFGTLVNVCCPGTLVGFLPWMVCHAPSSTRHCPLAVTQLTSGQIVQALVWLAAQRAVSTSTAANLRALGEAFVTVARLPALEFTRQLGRLCARQWAALASRWETLLQQYAEEPDFWTRDLRALLAQARQCEKDAQPPSDLAAAFGQESAWATLQQLVLQFGQLLDAWPLLVEAVRDLPNVTSR